MERFVFIGGIYPEFKMEEIKEKFGCLPQDAADMFQKNIINGLEVNLSSGVTLFNLYFLPASFFKLEKVEYYEWEGRFGSNYNVPFCRNRILGFRSKRKSLIRVFSSWAQKNAAHDRINVIVYPAYFPFVKAVSKLKRRFDIRVCLIVPDLPEYMGLTSRKTLYNKLSERYSAGQLYKNIGCIDSFIFLTEYMEKVVNKENKPYRIIEGIAPHYYEFGLRDSAQAKKSVVYSGKLQMRYGIDVYLKAISLIDDDSLSFDFYGTGEGVEVIKEYSKKDKRVSYKGYCLPEELHFVHQNSLLLINPRQNEQEFTKYSFPSKTMEYMISGRPVIAYKLDGMPDEYTNYIISPNDNSPEQLAKTILACSRLDEKELDEIGIRGREFVLNNKSSVFQAKKIIDLFNE